MNINTKDYWEKRFASGDWEAKRGRTQTRQFAETQIKYFKIDHDFSGTILDYGCGLGDAIPVYRGAYPRATLIGVDLSETAIQKCKAIYGSYARFIQGNYTDIPEVDVIVASNIFEHLSHDIRIAASLLTKCKELFIVTPYMENLTSGTEHINSYREDHFKSLGPYDYKIFVSNGWGENGWMTWLDIYIKNIFRPFLRRKVVRRQRQILFHFEVLTTTATYSTCASKLTT